MALALERVPVTGGTQIGPSAFQMRMSMEAAVEPEGAADAACKGMVAG
ncbi:hypothetical protein GCM10009095_18350 [Sphingomonas molluscorum]|nr:hypothetical protein GCM10017606_29520 [Microbacterium terregens]